MQAWERFEGLDMARRKKRWVKTMFEDKDQCLLVFKRKGAAQLNRKGGALLFFLKREAAESEH